MQPSDLDRKILSPLPSHITKSNRVTPPKNNYLSAVPSSPFNQEMSAKDISQDNNITSDSVRNKDINNPSEKASTENLLSEDSHHQDDKSNAFKGENDNKIPNLQLVLNSEETEKQGFLPVLKNSNFLALWGGQVFCQLADKVYLVLMIALINTQFQTGESSIGGWVSALMMAFTIPAVLFGSLAGVFVDRWSKKTVLVSTNIFRGILVLAIPPLLWFTHDWQPVGVLPVGFLIILGVTFLVSTLTQFFAPAEQAAIPLVVPEKDLLSANSLYTTTMMASVIVGFAVGEPLLAAADQIWSNFGGMDGLGKELVVGGSYAIAGLILLCLITKEKPQDATLEKPHVFADLKDGFGYLKTNKQIRNSLIQLVLLFSVFAALTVLAVRMAEIIPNLKPQQFGFLLAAGGVGIALGAIIIGQFGQRFSHRQLSLYGCLGMAVSLAGLAIFTQQLFIVLGLITLVGIFGALIGIPTQTAIQTETPAEMRGKVFGLQNNVINIALSLPLALAGIAEAFLGLRIVFFALSMIVFLGGAFTWYGSGE
nr:MFS transporter [Calothrix sp. PCC 6303]